MITQDSTEAFPKLYVSKPWPYRNAGRRSDCEDALRQVNSAESLDLVKRDLSSKYGDVVLIINPKADWFDQIKIEDEKWQADHESFCEKKAA